MTTTETSMLSRCKWFGGATFFMLLFAGTMFAQSAAARPDRGMMPAGAYSVSDLEKINLQNGNLSLSIPLAGLPPLAGGKLSWTLSAEYNSKSWDSVRSDHQSDPIDPGTRYTRSNLQQSDLSGWRVGAGYSIRFQDITEDYSWLPPPPNDPEYTLLTQNRWSKVVLTAPDGATHELRPIDFTAYQDGFLRHSYLRGYYKDNPSSVGAPMRYYSFDGSYLWARIDPAGDLFGGAVPGWTLYLPDGTKIEQSGGIQRITDTNGNKIKVFGDQAGVVTNMHYQDEQTGREIKYSYDPTGNNGKGMGQVQYQTVGGTWVAVDVNFDLTHVFGKRYEFGDPECPDAADYVDTQLTVVRSIVYPQTEPGQPAKQFTFGYNSDTTDAVSFQWRQTCSAEGYQTVTAASRGWGSLSQMHTPEGATVDYSYNLNDVHYLAFNPDDAPREGIATKTVTHDGTSDQWTYSCTPASGGYLGPDGSFVAETRYSSDPAFAHTYSGFGGKESLVYRVNNSNKTMIERHWALMNFGGENSAPGGDVLVAFNPQVDAEYTSLLADTPDHHAVKMSAKTFQYDFNGNILKTTEYDWFDPALVSRDAQGVPTGVPASAIVLRTVNNSYYNQATLSGSGNVYAKRSVAMVTPLVLNALQQTSVGSSATRLSYDGQAYGTTPTAGNLTSRSVWDDLDNKWITNSLAYDVYGNLISATDAKGKITQLYYDDLTHAAPDRVLADPQNGTGTQTTTTTYDYFTGFVTSRTDVNGNTTTIDYTNQLLNTVDPFARPGVTIGPLTNQDGNSGRRRTTTTYLDASRQLVVAADLNIENDKLLKSRTTSDMLGRPVLSELSEDGANYTIVVRKAYDTATRTTYTSNPMRPGTAATSDGWTRTTTDTTGRVTELATFGGAAQPSAGPASNISRWTGSVTTTYDANLTTVADQTGKLRRSVVDGLGRLIRVDEPDGNNNLGSADAPAQPTSYTFDALGNLRMVAQGSQTRTFTYDSLSRLRSAVNPESGTINYTYDDNGNLIQKADARNIVTSYAYDALNRQTSRSYSDGTPAVTYTYDETAGVSNPKGKLISISSSVSTYSYGGYDEMGRVSGATQTIGGVSYAVGYAYDLSGHVTSLTYPSGRTVTSAYDAAGRLNEIFGDLGDGIVRTYSTGITYDASSRMSKERFGTDRPVYNKLRYNSRGQLAEILVSTSYTDPADTDWNRGKIVNDYSNQCSGSGCNGAANNGNLLRQTVSVPSASTWYQQYDYDSLNRLQRVHEYTGNSSLDWQQEYGYDRWGNRTVQQSSTFGSGIPKPNFTVNIVNNRLGVPSGQTGTMTYDSAGNLTADTYSAGAVTRVYDAENRMTADTEIGSNANKYLYDGEGRRVKRYVATEDQETWQIYDVGGVLLAEYAANDNDPSKPQKEYGYRNGQLLVTAEPAPSCDSLGGECGNSGSRVVEGEVKWLVADQLGTPRMVFDKTGSLAGTKRHDYLPFGEELLAGTGQRATSQGFGVDDGVRQKFTQKERDVETGLDYFGARYYASVQGRFTGVDPSRNSILANNPQTWNRYAYTLNNPLAYVDQNGKWPTWIHNLIIDNALHGLGDSERQKIKDGSWSVDDPSRGGQDTSHANEHGMTIPGQSQEDAAVKADNFINTHVDKAQEFKAAGNDMMSLCFFGKAFHAVSDMTSPAHEGYQVWYKSQLSLHIDTEKAISNFRMGLAVGATIYLYRYTYGPQALRRAVNYLPGSENDPSVLAIQRQFSLPGSDPRAEAEALYEYRLGLQEGLSFDWWTQRGRRGRRQSERPIAN